MRTAVASALVTLLMVSGCGCGARPRESTILDSDAELNAALRGVVALVKEDPEEGGWRTFCSAFYIGPRRMLTAGHCVDDLLGSTVRFSRFHETNPDGRPYRAPRSARVLALDEDLDVAVLEEVGDRSPTWLRPAASIRVGEVAIVIGHPAAQAWTVTEGIVSRVIPSKHHVQVDATSWFGNSGCPALNARGRVLGVASQLRAHVAQFAYYVDVRAVRRWLGRVL